MLVNADLLLERRTLLEWIFEPGASAQGKRMRSVPVILQSEAPSAGIACLAMVASFHGHRTDLSAMRLRLSPSLKGVTLKHISQIAETMGMTSRGVQVPLESLGKLRLPAVLHWDMNHFVVLAKVSGRKITIHDPARGKRVLTLEEASRHFTGVAMEFTPTTGFQRKDERERISSWQLLGVASGLKGTLAQILLLSFALEVFAISMPFFLQLTVDRVLVGRDRDLLTVLGIAFGTLVVISVVVTAVRAWVGVYLSTHINLKLSPRSSTTCCGCRSRGSRRGTSATSSPSSAASMRSSARSRPPSSRPRWTG
jgi:ATP-binding cassette subfamily B protein RaxB